jgi:hypothetical protein
MTVAQVLASLSTHPWRLIVLRWNWKAVILSVALRGAIFFGTNLNVGVDAAVRAFFVDTAFRLPLVGAYAAIVQAFVGAEPPWAATAMVAAALPAVSHVIEFTVHRLAGTPVLYASVAISVAVSIVSSAFELFAMRRGVLLVGTGGSSFVDDVRRLPALFGAFLAELRQPAMRFVSRPKAPQ